MDKLTVDFPLVSALFITYNRFDHLRLAVESFRRNTDYPRLEIVIADDGSGAEVQEKIRGLHADKYALAAKNRGLGANNNAGMQLCSGKYVLMLQDDWVCVGPPHYLREAVKVMEANPDVGIINFAGWNNPADLSMRLSGSDEACYITPVPQSDESFLYTDQPHLQSMEAVQFVGPYRELPLTRSEPIYCRAWKEQTRFRTAVFPAWFMKVFQCDYAAPSFTAELFSRRSVATLLPVAQWLKQRCRPVYRISRSCFYSLVRVLEELRLVK